MSNVSAPTDEQTRNLAAWRATALEKMPYMASMIFSLRAVNFDGIESFAVDPQHRLYVNFEGITDWSVQLCAEALLHECGHLFGDHAARAQAHMVKDHELEDWNFACFPAGTLLPGNVPIESVATMSRPFDGELVEVTSQAGSVSATPDHPFFARKRRHKRGLHPIVLNDPEWVNATDLDDSHYLCVPRLAEKVHDATIDLRGYAISYIRAGTNVANISNRTVREIPLNTETAWLIGLYVAEGSASPSVVFSLASYEDEIIERVQKVIDMLGWSSSRQYNYEDHTCAVATGTTVFGRWLKSHCGARASEKHVPELIMRHSDRAIRRAFLEGLNSGDGYTRNWNASGEHRNYTVNTSSVSLMHDIILLLAQDSMGGHTRIEAQRPRTIKGVPMPEGMLYGVTWNPDGARPSTRVLNGTAVSSYSHRWKTDTAGVWYPIKAFTRRTFVGRVYNLTTPSHTYIAHGYLVHNCDAEINDDLVQAGCCELAKMCITPKSLGMPDNDLAEVYFDGIKAKRAKQPQPPQSGQGQPQPGGPQGQQPQPQPGQGQPGNGQPLPGQGQPGQGSGPTQPGQGQPANGQGQCKFAGCGSGSGGEVAPCELGDGDGNGAAPGATDAEHQRVRIQTSAAIAEHVAKGRGTVPGGLVETARQVLAPPKIPWRQTLAAFMRLAVKRGGGGTHTTYAKSNKRKRKVHLPNGSRVLFPGTYTPRVTLAVVRDTSGSMGAADLADATNEIVGIAAAMQIKDDDLRILDVDARVQTVKGFKNAATLDEVSGRGGTDMCVGIDRAMELDPKPTVIVVCTDGFTPWPRQQTSIPIIACLIGQGAERLRDQVPDWMLAVVVDRD